MILDCNEMISERLWVGRYVLPENMSYLTQLGITNVLSLQSDEDLKSCRIPVKKLLKAYRSADIEFERIGTTDFDPEALSRNLATLVDRLEAALAHRWARIYLHCTAGVNRAPTVTAAYLMKSQKLTSRQAYEFVRAHRHCRPFRRVLEDYEASLVRFPG